MNTRNHREDEELLDKKFQISLRNAYAFIAGVLVCTAAVLGVYYSFKLDIHDLQNSILMLKAEVRALEKRIELMENKK